ncbi:MAG: lysine 5,6-aminomutase subunit alpha [Candidatus Izemoplasmatales bacterium]|jgi:beta-lysine 5,6-aminomutase alpha subunit|nr:lysine 5,6-aminomutase subunit alpha [Candidatus Izemoplasmatales bacterium]
MNKLNLNKDQINSCRIYASKIADNVQSFIDKHTTLSVERTVLRLLGVDGIDDFSVPLPNKMVDDVVKNGNINKGISVYIASALKATGLTMNEFIDMYLNEKISLCDFDLIEDKKIAFEVLKPYYDYSLNKIKKNKKERDEFLKRFPRDKTDLYVIVATGNIDEDVIQAVSAAKAGADIIAVIRSTGQSLLDYVPYGKTTEGFGGTFATQENFRIMRQALDKVSEEEKRYIYLVNYASGLCMPEIACMGALERLDVLLNDSMYGIIFRDINMQRTFVDQYFSRLINAYSGIIINTGEDNYLTTADAIEEAHTVTASQFINEAFALKAHLPSKLMGLGHAFEINPDVENSFLYELAQAQLAREIFPEAPLKYMPPTKHINGNIFRAYQQNAMFNMVTTITSQSIHLLGMMTEAIHTPFMSDRYLAIKNAKMIQQSMKSLGEEIEYKSNGIIQNRAHEVLNSAEKLLKQIAQDGLFISLENGVFAQTKRTRIGGKGLTGVFEKSKDYYNVVLEKMEEHFNEN